jgi:undecaprenyl-diphosphatase
MMSAAPWRLARKASRFAARHAWSLGLSGLSAVCFLHLGFEIREGELDTFDRAVAVWLQGTRGQLDWPMLALTRFGEVRALTLLTVAATLVLAVVGRRREAVYVLTCACGAALSCSALKLLFRRVRPDAAAPYLGVTLPESFSYPSGHAMGSMAIVGSLVIVAWVWPVAKFWRVVVVIIALPVVLGVAASRVYFGVHFPSDVLGGQLASAAWVAALTGWYFPRLIWRRR